MKTRGDTTIAVSSSGGITMKLIFKMALLSGAVLVLVFSQHNTAQAAINNHAISSQYHNNLLLKNDIEQRGLYNKFYFQSLQFYKKGETAKATNLLKMLARLDHAPSQYLLGTMYMFGKGIKKDETCAVYWYKKAANNGHAKAKYNLGIAYANGIGVLVDMGQAIDWWQSAASQGSHDAQYNLGLIYSQGVGVKRNAKEAVQWYQMAAINGDPAAQYNLGVMYAKGDGVEKDYVQAVQWWQRSAKQGFKQARNVLHMLSTER